MSDRGPRQSWLANVGLAVAVVVVFGGGLELLARLTERQPGTPKVAKYIWNWKRMWDGDFYTMGSASVGWPPWEKFNADGVRDRTHSVERLPRTWRLVFLGDSVTLGAGLNPGEDFPRVIGSRLLGEGKRIEVFNVSLWGWSTVQERRAYERIARQYKPDEVVLAVCLNDIPELQNNLARPPAWLTSLYRHSAVVRRVVGAQRREIASVEQLFREPDSPQVQRAFGLFRDEVRRLQREVEGDGARLALVVLPFRFQVMPKAPAPIAQESIATMGRDMGIEVHDLLPFLRQVGPKAFLDYDHLSRLGARLVADHLVRSSLVPPGFSYDEDLAAWRREHPSEPIDRALAAPAPAVREAAAWRASHEGVHADVGTLGQLLGHDSDPGVRCAAARSLGSITGAPASTRARLFAGLNDASQPVRWACADALHAIGVGRDDLDALVAQLGNQDPRVRGFAAWSLAEMGPAAGDATPALLEALQREGPARVAIADALARLGGGQRDTVAALIRSLRSGGAGERAGAAQALGRLGHHAEGAVPDLTEALDSSDASVRREAARALSRLGLAAKPAASALRRRLVEDRDPPVRALAARALRVVKDAAACEALGQARRDAHRRVRREAAEAFEALCQPAR
jgi:HEAT repeat protein/lysophospholipase L1-like esterase